MPFHFCTDELLAILALIPFIGIFFGKLHTWWHKHFHHKCHEKDCSAEHVEHCHMPAHIPHGKAGEGQCDQHPYSPFGRHDFHPVSKEDMKYLIGMPAPLKITVPITIEKPEEKWDSICQEDVEEKFGDGIFLDLMVEVMLAALEYPVEGNLCWFINQDSSSVMVHMKERVFLCNVASEKKWTELLQ